MRIFSVAAALLACSAAAQDTTVQTVYGPVQGRVNEKSGNQYFFGIRYAAPPVGKLRYAPPAAPEPWTEPKVLGDHPEPECAQANMNGVIQGQEDCLTLDVYRPNTGASGLPVLVWIYGGGFVSGDDDSGDRYNGDKFAAYQNVIVVAMNYRLGSLGFLALPALKGEHNTTGNYGLLDQQFALKWVHENVAAFGGDPAKVTIFGQSAGAVSVVAQLSMPASQRYFRAAIAESSLPVGDISWASYENATAFGHAFVEKVGCNTTDMLACLRNLPVTEALEPELDWRRNYPGDFSEIAPRLMPVMPYWPVIDGSTLPMSPIDLAESGGFPDKPFIMGTNKDEGTVFSELTPLMVNVKPPVAFPLTQHGFNQTMLHFFNATTARAIIDFYANASSPTVAANTVIRDYIFACAARHLLRTILSRTPNRQSPLYTYQFRPNLHDSYFGDYHSAEIPFVFNQSSPFWTAELKDLSTVMHSYWASMATEGKPSCPQCPGWNQYAFDKATDTDNYLVFETPTPRNDKNLLSSTCDFWDRIGYKQNP
ncbi:Crystal protein [Diplonema papillatum]|nr:Crystal protein [Diplonema papillatum]|eukprot:gene11697-18039_t